LNSWARNGYRGIVNAVTGSGKTVLALTAIRHLEIIADRELRVKIVVPQTFLASQWKDEIKRYLGAKAADIGTYCGKKRDQGRKYMIYVINSARYSLARHILSDFNEGRSVFLIADECHHYGSLENNRIFDFYEVIARKDAYYALGLSATPEIVNFKAISIPLGQEIYSYDLRRALKDRIISRFVLFCIKLDFTPEERADYEEMSGNLQRCMIYLKREHPELSGLPQDMFFANLQRLAKQDSAAGQMAQTALTLIYNRRTLCHMAQERPLRAVAIVKALPARSRVILFCERIQAAEALYRDLSETYPGQTGLYHSKMADNARQVMLERYQHGALRLLICCKALDEGLNIPSTDAGIIVSTSLSARQRVQRLGRILRHSKEIKRIYFLYIGQSSEDKELVLGLRTLENDVPLIALGCREGAFVHPEYERLRGIVQEYVTSRTHDPKLIGALNQNIDKALLRGDFLLSEPQCKDNIRATRNIAEKNYWTSALYVILARLGKLI